MLEKIDGKWMEKPSGFRCSKCGDDGHPEEAIFGFSCQFLVTCRKCGYTFNNIQSVVTNKSLKGTRYTS